MMSSEALSGVPVDVVGGAEDLSKTAVEVQAEVHTDAKPDENGTISDTHINSNGTELDPIESEERDVLAPLTNQISNENTGIVSMGSGTSVTYSAGNDEFVVQMKQVGSSTEKTPPSPKYSRMSLRRRQPSLLRRFSQESSLSLQESWRSKSAHTRLKHSKNNISFHNITYTVPQGRFFQKKPPKVILNNIRLVNKHTQFSTVV